jgi:hypothetical protein
MTSQDALYHKTQNELVGLWLVGRVTYAGTRRSTLQRTDLPTAPDALKGNCVSTSSDQVDGRISSGEVSGSWASLLRRKVLTLAPLGVNIHLYLATEPQWLCTISVNYIE